MSTPLRIVPSPLDNRSAPSDADGLGERIQQLQGEARRLAREHIDALAASLVQTQRIAEQIARGGDIYPPGARDIARRLCEECVAKAMTLEAIADRTLGAN